jgi:hypothetical protein
MVVVPFFGCTEYVKTGSDVVYFSSVDKLNGPEGTGIVKVGSRASSVGYNTLESVIKSMVSCTDHRE